MLTISTNELANNIIGFQEIDASYLREALKSS